MIRDAFIYDHGGVDALREGYYLHGVGSGRVDVPVRIWFGPPVDPETGEVLDRSPRWQVEINGIPFGDDENPPVIAGRPLDSLEGIWPQCLADPITAAEYQYRVDRAEYAEAYDPDDPFSRTGGKVDPMTARLPFS